MQIYRIKCSVEKYQSFLFSYYVGGNQITANGTLLVSNSAAAAAVDIPTLRSASNATIGSIGSLSELEEEAIKQYRNSDESMEEKLAVLEREAQEQYSY